MGRLSLIVLVLATCAFAADAFQAHGNQKAALEACGLPTEYRQTSHCFNDRTHHTCCMLGPEARAYADSSGNPIGTAAVRAHRALTGAPPGEDELAPWCTCFGSLVCSHYASMFDDGTHVKFINNPSAPPGAPDGAFDIPKTRECEAKAREFYNVQAHATPGVDVAASFESQSSGCPEYHPSEHIHRLDADGHVGHVDIL